MRDEFIWGEPEGDAWSTFTRLVLDGAGMQDVVGASIPPGALPSADDVAYQLGLVEHHARNSIPFLLGPCALAGKRVLEIGSGTGALAVALALAGVAHVEGVEPNADNHAAGIARVRAHRLGHCIRLSHRLHTTPLPFADGAFDATIASSVLQYVRRRERERILVEMHRVTCDGGLVIVCNSGNALYPGGPHASTRWSNWLPALAELTGARRGVSWFEIRRVLDSLGVEPVMTPGGLDRLRRRVLARGSRGARRTSEQALLAAAATAGRGLERWAGIPVEALLPYVAVAFRKVARARS